VMGEGGGVIGSAAMSVKRALAIATTLKAVLGLSEFEKGVGGLESSGRSDAGATARTIGFLLTWMAEQQDVFVFATANDVRQRAIRPTSEVKREQVGELRRWAGEHLAVDAARGRPAAGDRRLEF